MNWTPERLPGRTLFTCLSGSRAYGTNRPDSDTDTRGVFMLAPEQYLSLQGHPEEVADDRQDTKFYDLRKFMKLAADCNPNILELLFVPESCRLSWSDGAEALYQNRHAFVSKQAHKTFSGYAYSQIKKAKGQNKMVNTPQPVEMPKKADSCYLVANVFITHNTPVAGAFRPPRMIPVSKQYPLDQDLSSFHASRVEHTQHLYRLYRYDDQAKGVFRGDDMVVCESIPIEDEDSRYAGLMYYDQSAYEGRLRDWNRYWQWMRERNPTRWIEQEGETVVEQRYDQKNMCQCIRLLLSCQHLLTTGEPFVRVPDQHLTALMAIRNGQTPYEEIVEMAKRLMDENDRLVETSRLPERTDVQHIDRLFTRLLSMS